VLAPAYGAAVEKVLETLSRKRDFSNDREGKFGSAHLRQRVEAVEGFQELAHEQKGHDILIVAAQLGLRHSGRSVRRAREVFKHNEFGLGTFAAGCMLLVHPKRFVRRRKLNLDCSGDEFSELGDEVFSCAPLFFLEKGVLHFSASRREFASSYHAPASALLLSDD